MGYLKIVFGDTIQPLLSPLIHYLVLLIPSFSFRVRALRIKCNLQWKILCKSNTKYNTIQKQQKMILQGIRYIQYKKSKRRTLQGACTWNVNQQKRDFAMWLQKSNRRTILPCVSQMQFKNSWSRILKGMGHMQCEISKKGFRNVWAICNSKTAREVFCKVNATCNL